MVQRHLTPKKRALSPRSSNTCEVVDIDALIEGNMAEGLPVLRHPIVRDENELGCHV
jgi:hypothetical protein